jgi:hypothetical protein
MISAMNAILLIKLVNIIVDMNVVLLIKLGNIIVCSNQCQSVSYHYMLPSLFMTGLILFSELLLDVVAFVNLEPEIES